MLNYRGKIDTDCDPDTDTDLHPAEGLEATVDRNHDPGDEF
jgi:hypothetical protein